MYAVLVTGGKQYRVMQGETLRVEKLDIEAGKDVTFDQILMLGDGEGVKLGDALKGATVSAKVVGHGRADKVRIIVFNEPTLSGEFTVGDGGAPWMGWLIVGWAVVTFGAALLCRAGAQDSVEPTA